MFELVFGTGNEKKARELAYLLRDQPCRLTTLADYPEAIEVDETADTFAGNADLKASQQAVHLNRWVIADDSGLTVDTLGGDPGVRSARYAGRHGDDAANNALLLQNLDGTPADRRGASFVCCLSVADPSGEIRLRADGRCRGRILTEPRGRAGFGYDPLFEIPEYHRTYAEMGLTVKSVLSHRARAFAELLPGVLRLIST